MTLPDSSFACPLIPRQPDMPDPIDPTFRSRDPLHGVTLEMMLHRLVNDHGWPGLADRIPVRCFMFDPSITSSLKFLRKTPWARKKIEDLYRQLA
jgi:uncharacterized protein (DUF2132 family)